MTALALKKTPKIATLADLVDKLGGIPLDRIRADPNPGEATEADVIRLMDGDDKHLCELIDGVLVEKAMGNNESLLAGLIIHFLWDYLRANKLGAVFGEAGYVRIRVGRIRIPDVSFVPWGHLKKNELKEKRIIDAVPTLAVEVLSESNTRKEMEDKLDDYFHAGVKLVWYVDPDTETVDVYTSRKRKRTLDVTQSLDGGKVLPGFSLPIRELFETAEPPEEPKE